MKPVFSPDRLATTDLTHTIIGASNLTNSVLASDLCRQALQEKRMEIQASPRRSVEVKCTDVLHCHLGKVTISPSFSSGSPLPPPFLPFPTLPFPSLGAPGCRVSPRCSRCQRGVSGSALPARRRALKQQAARQPPGSSSAPRALHVPGGTRGFTQGKREKES